MLINKLMFRSWNYDISHTCSNMLICFKEFSSNHVYNYKNYYGDVLTLNEIKSSLMDHNGIKGYSFMIKIVLHLIYLTILD